MDVRERWAKNVLEWIHTKPLNGAVGIWDANILKSEKETGKGKTPLKDGKEKEETTKKLTIAAAGVVYPGNAPTVTWAKFLSLSSK